MRYSIDELLALVAVVELNSFSLAAQKLNITQPALSRRISNIEDNIGDKLLVRSKKKIEPTKIGYRFYNIAKRLVIEFQSTEAELLTIKDDDTGKVSISINMTWCSVIIPTVVERFRQLYPNYTLNIIEGSSSLAVKKVYDGEVDLGVTHKPKRLYGVDFEPILNEEFLVACHRDHPLAALEVIPSAELKKHVWMRLLRDELFSSLDWIAFDGASNFPDTLVNANHYVTILRLVDSNLGVTILPRMAIHQFKGENIVLRSFAEPMIRRMVGVLTKQKRDLSPAAEKLNGIIREVLASYR
ncbi:MAG: LysR family transcriptional regulator [Rhodospirillum sp.]|nr:LysR family transcriptional regulator [Rhodospirillum sp.]MCF8489283.1 LysR family transcriptional regulator [Rhodospirillum sp.]MCF8502004.1 LysR family transcriptional regulator [Rhodospirillum sp.]